MAMKLDHDELDRLIEKISTSDIQEFSLEGEDFKPVSYTHLTLPTKLAV